MGFQTYVQNNPAPGRPGDFAGTNPRMSAQAGPGGFVAPAQGTVVGRMAFGNPATNIAGNFYQDAANIGFVHTENQALITAFLADSGLIVPGGFPLTLMSRGDFWAQFLAGCTFGQKVYADPVTGSVTAAATGNGVRVTGFTGAISTAGLLTVSGAGVGAIAPGQIVLGAGVPAGTFIVSNGTGAGGVGTYNLNQAPAVAIGAQATTFQGLYETRWSVATTVPVNAAFTGALAVTGVLTVSAVASGAIADGMVIAGAGIVGRVTVVNRISGTPGGVGVYQTNLTSSPVIAAEAMTGTFGKVAKITNWGL